MPNSNLIANIQTVFPTITLQKSDHFAWNPESSTVFYDTTDIEKLFHELGHATLEHDAFSRDIDLIKMERDAWKKAHEIAAHFHQHISLDTQEDAMDSYREWLHARSSCPTCSQNGIQVSASEYRCPLCESTWRVNDARICGLKRQLQPQK